MLTPEIMGTRYKKVIGDLKSDYRRNLLLIAAIAIGVFGIGAMLGGYSVLKREMRDNYMGTVPASATIDLEDTIPKAMIEQVEHEKRILVAERHATLNVRMKIDNKWYPLLLFVIDDFEQKRLNKVYSVEGKTNPLGGHMLVERTALVVMRANIGDEIIIKTPNGEPQPLRIVGTVHDPGLAPAWQEEAGYGYVTLSTVRALGEDIGFNQLRILVRENQQSRDHITTTAQKLAATLEKQGYHVHEIQVPSPGKHPHQSQMTTVMNMFVIFSFFVLILGSILVAASISTLMVRQIRQIGVMKTIGAGTVHIGKLYGAIVVILSVAALAVAIPLSRFAASAFYDNIAVLLNLEIRDATIPLWVLVVQIATGIGVPLLIAAYPIIRGSRISVRQALDNFGVSQGFSLQKTWLLRMLQHKSFSGTFNLSLRNIFRQRGRVTMSLILLAAGGAMFMTAMNVSKAWDRNLERIYEQRFYDIDLRLAQLKDENAIVEAVKGGRGVRAVEVWGQWSAAFPAKGEFNVTGTYPDKGHGSLSVIALPPSTSLLRPTVTAGRWLADNDQHGVVLNQIALGQTTARLGDKLIISVNNISTEWTVVGYTEDVGSPAIAYVSIDEFSKGMDMNGANSLRVACNDRSKGSVVAVTRAVENLVERKGIEVSSTVPVWLLHNAVAAHMKVLVNSLMAFALLMALVGTIGLTSTMSLNVLERTREIGVMRAIGATPRRIKWLILWEGLMIGVFSIVLAFAGALILSTFMGQLIGNMAFRTPLSLVISAAGFLIWIAIVLAGSYAATALPARRAISMTTREALAYE
jgi:putative ABC transport system permease protein